MITYDHTNGVMHYDEKGENFMTNDNKKIIPIFIKSPILIYHKKYIKQTIFKYLQVICYKIKYIWWYICLHLNIMICF